MNLNEEICKEHIDDPYGCENCSFFRVYGCEFPADDN